MPETLSAISAQEQNLLIEIKKFLAGGSTTELIGVLKAAPPAAGLTALLAAIPVAEEGNLISARYHNALRAALFALAARIGVEQSIALVANSFDADLSMPEKAGEDKEVWQRVGGRAFALLNSDKPRVYGSMAVSLPHGATIKSLAAFGLRSPDTDDKAAAATQPVGTDKSPGKAAAKPDTESAFRAAADAPKPRFTLFEFATASATGIPAAGDDVIFSVRLLRFRLDDTTFKVSAFQPIVTMDLSDAPTQFKITRPVDQVGASLADLAKVDNRTYRYLIEARFALAGSTKGALALINGFSVECTD